MNIPTPPIPANMRVNMTPNIPAAPVSSAAPTNPAQSATIAPAVNVGNVAAANVSAAKSCEDCIFFVAATDYDRQIKIMGKVTGGSICVKREMFLTNIYTEAAKAPIMKEIGSKCSDFDSDSDPAGADLLIALACETLSISEARENSPGDQNYTSDNLSDCQSCIFFNVESDTIEKAGLPVKSCSRRNIAIADSRTISTASHCNVSASVSNIEASHTLGVYVIDTHAGTAPLRTSSSTVNSDSSEDNQRPVSRGRRRAIDPTMPADKAATQDDMAMGIRGWRKIVNQSDSDMAAYLPIFDPQFFDVEQRAMIPMTGDDEHPEDFQDHQNLLYKVAGLWKMGMTPAVNGIPGTGKTEFFRYAAWVMQLPFVRLSIDNRTEKDDLAGKMHVSPDKGTYFKYGRLTSQWSKPCVMLVDEPNTGPDEVWQFLRPLTDNSKQLVLDTNEGERIQKHEHNFLGMAFNPAWDMRNVGTHEISAADASRLMHIQVTPPNSTLERKIVQKACKHVGFTIPDEKLETVMNIAKDIRELSENDFPLHWGVREQIKVARVLSFLDMRDAYRMAIADFLDPDQAEQIFQIVRAHDAAQITGARRGRPPGSKNRPKF